MKVVILAGGYGTRISEESSLKPKPLIDIGEFPIIWHIMKIYSSYGFNEFIICLGYKGHLLKDFFLNYFIYRSDVTVDYSNDNEQVIHQHSVEPWKITLANTGLNTMTGSRIKQIQKFIGNKTFMLTYGDGVADINISKLVDFHKNHGKIATLTATQPSGRFGSLGLTSADQVTTFREKLNGDGGWINGGFFVLEPEFFSYIDNPIHTILEKEPLEKLAKEDQLMAYRHHGFWHPMDTLRDKIYLESLWNNDRAPWKVWK